MFRPGDGGGGGAGRSPVLNAEQQAAFEGLDALAAAGRPAAALLYGVTGSGKTQVYLRLIYEALARGRTAMVLVPEIALTPSSCAFRLPLPGTTSLCSTHPLRAGSGTTSGSG